MVTELKNYSTVIPVVAVALIGGDRRILLQLRKRGGEHGGLWEFPGGKIEPGETPETAIVREIAEELGVAPGAGQRSCRSPAPRETDPGARPYVILLYTCRAWAGEPQCHVGEEIAWFAPAELAGLAMPPLDVPLARALIETI